VNRALTLASTWSRSTAADAALALALAAYSQLELWGPTIAIGVGPADAVGAKALLVPTALLATLPLALRRRYPFAVLCIVTGAIAAQALLTAPLEGLSGAIALVVAVYSLGAHSERWPALLGLAIALVAVIPIAEDTADFAFDALVVVGPWLVGRSLRTHRLRARDLEVLAAALANEREERARLAVAAERTRIARELHDVVAHSVSTMVVQAEAGEALLDQDASRAREAFDSIQRTGREALAEMRRLLGLLRRGDEDLSLGPQPSMEHLEHLLGRMRAAGLPVDLDVEGDPRPLPPGLDLSAYRIVQEALTNTLKHAGRVHARVTVRYGHEALELEIADDGGSAGNSGNGGYGLAGMRERVRLFGGEVEAGKRPEGGYAVRARLPFGE
jgi:signal transduction histidine kinase